VGPGFSIGFFHQPPCYYPEYSNPGARAQSHHLLEATAPPEMEMETEAASARQAKESLELAFQMSQILDTGLDRHTLSLLMALCDRGANPEALAALVRELSSAAPPTAAAAAVASPVSNGAAAPAPATASMFPSGLRRP
jgi:mitotic-spindle organizing protein 1